MGKRVHIPERYRQRLGGDHLQGSARRAPLSFAWTTACYPCEIWETSAPQFMRHAPHLSQGQQLGRTVSLSSANAPYAGKIA